MAVAKSLQNEHTGYDMAVSQSVSQGSHMVFPSDTIISPRHQKIKHDEKRNAFRRRIVNLTLATTKKRKSGSEIEQTHAGWNDDAKEVKFNEAKFDYDFREEKRKSLILRGRRLMGVKTLWQSALW